MSRPPTTRAPASRARRRRAGSSGGEAGAARHTPARAVGRPVDGGVGAAAGGGEGVALPADLVDRYGAASFHGRTQVGGGGSDARRPAAPEGGRGGARPAGGGSEGGG